MAVYGRIVFGNPRTKVYCFRCYTYRKNVNQETGTKDITKDMLGYSSYPFFCDACDREIG